VLLFHVPSLSRGTACRLMSSAHPAEAVLLDRPLPRGGVNEVMAVVDEQTAAAVPMSADKEMLSLPAAFGYLHLGNPLPMGALLEVLGRSRKTAGRSDAPPSLSVGS
jgi:hypothetical protein